MTKEQKMQFALRIGVFGTFFGHGWFALFAKPAWIPLLTSLGFSNETALVLLPMIGVLDIIVALIVLFKPIKLVLIWAMIWAFLAALSRLTAGQPFCEFVERTALWICPLVLLIINGWPKKWKDLLIV